RGSVAGGVVGFGPKRPIAIAHKNCECVRKSINGRDVEMSITIEIRCNHISPSAVVSGKAPHRGKRTVAIGQQHRHVIGIQGDDVHRSIMVDVAKSDRPGRFRDRVTARKLKGSVAPTQQNADSSTAQTCKVKLPVIVKVKGDQLCSTSYVAYYRCTESSVSIPQQHGNAPIHGYS